MWVGVGAHVRLPVSSSPAVDLFGESPSRLVVSAAPRARRRPSSCSRASTACRSSRSGPSGGERLVIELAGAGATGAAEERGLAASRTRSTSPSRTCCAPGSTACRARSAGPSSSTAMGPPLADVRRLRRLAPARLRARRRPRSPRPACSRSSIAARNPPASPSATASEIFLYKDLGMIAQVLDDRRLPGFRGDLAIAHCRYSTTGSTIWENAQPTFRLGPRRAVAIGHNGNLVNTRELLDPARGRPRPPRGDHRHGAPDDAPRRRAGGGHGRGPAAAPAARPRRLLAARPRPDRIIGIRDPHGFRPLVLGRIPEVATTTDAALRGRSRGRATAGSCRRRRPGSTSSARSSCATSSRARWSSWSPAASRARCASRPPTPALCVFEMIYFARPDSYMEGRNLYEVRRRMGEQLAASTRRTPTSSCPFPDTGAPAAAGYAEASGMPYREGLVRNRYTGRTFIQPSQTMRHRGVTMKLNPLREVVRGKRLTVVDDSIVRGTTTKQIVALLRKAGAEEVHVRISAPPIFHPCFYGIDTQIDDRAHRRDELGRRDPRLHRRRLARLPVDRRRPRGARPAVRPVLLRLLRRQLPGARPVRRLEPQVHARGGGAGTWREGDRDAARRRGRPTRRPGVDVAAGERAVELMRDAVESTRRPEVHRRRSAASAGRSRSRPATASR